MKIKYILKTLKTEFRIFSSFPQFWLFIAIMFLSVIFLTASWCIVDDFWASMCSNIFAGLITGLVLSLLSGTRQIYFVIQEGKLHLLEQLHEKILEYMELRHRFLSNDYGDLDRDDFIYDMGAHANWVNEFIIQGMFDKKSSFNSCNYCKKYYGYVHDELGIMNYSDKQSVMKLFEQINNELFDLDSKVCRDIRAIETKIETARRSII